MTTPATTYEVGKVIKSKVATRNSGTTSYIIYERVNDGQRRLIWFEGPAVVLKNDTIHVYISSGTSWAVFSKTTEWRNVASLLREEYGFEIGDLPNEQIAHRIANMEAGGALADIAFALEMRGLQSMAVPKIYDVDHEIIYHAKP